MVADRELHERLTRLGSRPVPPPRAEFVDGLLHRLLTDDVSDAAGVVSLDSRRRRVAARAAWVVSAAAALVIAVLAVGMLSGGPGSTEGTALALAAAPGTAGGVEVTVDDDGTIRDLPDDQATGTLEFTCTGNGRFSTAAGDEYLCVKGEQATVQVENKRIIAVEGLTLLPDSQPLAVIRLDFTETKGSASPAGTWRWEAADAGRFARYLLLRRAGADPVYNGAGTEVVTEVPDRATTSYTDTDVRLDAWTYQLVVLDANGEVSAISDLVTLKPSSD